MVCILIESGTNAMAPNQRIGGQNRQTETWAEKSHFSDTFRVSPSRTRPDTGWEPQVSAVLDACLIGDEETSDCVVVCSVWSEPVSVVEKGDFPDHQGKNRENVRFSLP